MNAPAEQPGAPAEGDQPTVATFLPEPEPRVRSYTIISVDDHLIEPPETFDGRLPKKWRDRAPRCGRLLRLEGGRVDAHQVLRR